MEIATNAESVDDSVTGSSTRRTQGALLVCGVVAGLLYVVADVVCGLLYEGYSFADQHISELGAAGAQTRALLTTLVTVHLVLVGVFAVGVWRSAGRSRALRWTAGLLITVAVVGLLGGIFAPMNPRGTEAGFAATMHLVYIGVNALMIMVAMGLSSMAFGWRFRVYAIGSVLIMLIFGAWAGSYAEEIEAGLPTPGAGVIERISVYAWLLWLVLLAAALRRRTRHSGTPPTAGHT